LRKRVFNTPSSCAQVRGQVLHIRAITDTLSPSLLDSLDEIGRILWEGTVVEGPIVRVGTNQVLNGGIEWWGREGNGSSTFKMGPA
jgi:hypothetical protein